jgi:hypothetical protein
VRTGLINFLFKNLTAKMLGDALKVWHVLGKYRLIGPLKVPMDSASEGVD